MKVSRQAAREGTQLFRSCLIDGVLEAERVRQVVRQIAATKPRGYLDMLCYLLRLVKVHQAEHAAKVESAVTLSADLRAGVQTRLTELYGPEVIASFAVNPALIGGMRIQVGSDVYDGSIRARLALLQKSF